MKSKTKGDHPLRETHLTVYDKILLVLLTGTIWGVAELFGWDMLHHFNVEHPSIWLFSVTFFILFAAKIVLRFPGALIPVAVITVLYKTIGVKFFKCQTAAVMIDAAVIDIAYHVIKERRYKNWKVRSVAAPVIAFCAMLFFGLYREFLYAAPGFETSGFEGAFRYVLYSGIPAMIISAMIVHPAWYAGLKLRESTTGIITSAGIRYAYASAALLLVVMWALLAVR